MSTKFHRRVRQILERAAEMPAPDRDAYIQRICGADKRLKREVWSLLPHYVDVEGFEPDPPRDTKFCVPGTTTFTRAGEEAKRMPTAPDPDPEPPLMIGRYTAMGVLGRGGMGIVYRAVDPRRPYESVAVKVLRKGVISPEDRWRFKLEEEVLRQLQHPGIARMLDAGVARLAPMKSGVPADEEAQPFFAMEYVAGRPLTKYADEHELDVPERLELMVRVCEAVEYAHHRGIIHRDLKPDNILVKEDGQPKILDFGISQVLALEWSRVKNEDGFFAGTPAYASPEQLAGKNRDLTPASDVFTLGLVSHELLVGRLPDRKLGKLRMAVRDLRMGSASELRCVDSAAFREELHAVLAMALRRRGGPSYVSAGQLAVNIARLLEYFTVPSRWAQWRAWLARFFGTDSDWAPGPTSRPLSAVLRKRIEMAIESDVEHGNREQNAARKKRAPDDSTE